MKSIYRKGTERYGNTRKRILEISADGLDYFCTVYDRIFDNSRVTFSHSCLYLMDGPSGMVHRSQSITEQMKVNLKVKVMFIVQVKSR